jgi:hypothetical protein
MIINIKNSRLINTAIIFAVSLFVVVQVIRVAAKGTVFGNVPDFFISDLNEELSEEVSGNDFGDGKGVITVSCGPCSLGGVYLYVNGTIEASLSGGESKTLRISVGDVIIAMGHDLVSPVEVKIDTAIGRFDCSIQNTGVSVGNKGKLLAIIKKFDL